MNEDEIKNILLQDNTHNKINFVGVFSRTRIPITSTFPAGYIINLDNFGSEGIHWIGVYVTEKYINIFDSFGGNFLNDGFFSAFLRSYQNKRRIVSSQYEIQSINSNTCGLYSILFILVLSRGFSLNQFVNLFNFKNTKCNDLAIVQFFSELLNKNFFYLI